MTQANSKLQAKVINKIKQEVLKNKPNTKFKITTYLDFKMIDLHKLISRCCESRHL